MIWNYSWLVGGPLGIVAPNRIARVRLTRVKHTISVEHASMVHGQAATITSEYRMYSQYINLAP